LGVASLRSGAARLALFYFARSRPRRAANVALVAKKDHPRFILLFQNTYLSEICYFGVGREAGKYLIRFEIVPEPGPPPDGYLPKPNC